MSYRNNPPASVVTSLSKNSVLIPQVAQWVQWRIVTGDHSVIPKIVHFSRLFYVTKKGGRIRPILDLSFLNTFIVTPRLKMEAISSILPHLIQGIWASSLDVTDAFLSVSLSQPFQRYFLLYPEWVGFYVPQTPIWADYSPLGLFQTDENHQEISKASEI